MPMLLMEGRTRGSLARKAMTTRPRPRLVYLRYASLALVIVVGTSELYAVIDLFMRPNQYRFGTEVAGAIYFSRERYLAYHVLTLVMAMVSLGVSAFKRDRWWPIVLQLASMAFWLSGACPGK